MMQYAAKRILSLIPSLAIVSFLVFSILLLLPGDPTFALLGEAASQQQRLELREQMGLDEPIPIQYGIWLLDTLQGDLGRSLRTQEPVLDMLTSRFPVTLELTVLSVLVAIFIGVPAGVIAAISRNTWLDAFASFVALAGLALPYFWAGILLITFFSLHLRWLPPSGYVPFIEDPVENLKLMILPSLSIGTALAALIMRQTRTSMLQVLSQDYVRTARAKGVGEYGVITKHAFRNALIPIVTVIGLQAGNLIGGAVVTETVFSLPGLGRMVVEGVFERDLAPVQAGILVIVVAVLLINLLTDLAYVALDKRIKL